MAKPVPKLIPTATVANWTVAARCSECGEPILHTDPKLTNQELLNQQLHYAFQKHLASCPGKDQP